MFTKLFTVRTLSVLLLLVAQVGNVLLPQYWDVWQKLTEIAAVIGAGGIAKAMVKGHNETKDKPTEA